MPSEQDEATMHGLFSLRGECYRSNTADAINKNHDEGIGMNFGGHAPGLGIIATVCKDDRLERFRGTCPRFLTWSGPLG